MSLVFLEARDARQRQLERLLSEAGGDSVLMISANIPGADKLRPGLARLLRSALDSLQEGLALDLRLSGTDPLGPYFLAYSAMAPAAAKLAAVTFEARNPAGRLVDVDVYQPDGIPVDRARLGLPPRTCLLCGEPARECILLRRHGALALLGKVDGLLRSFAAPLGRVEPTALAAALCQGARQELELTPKPGLVDRQDCGSHPDLTYERMCLSVGLLPRFYEGILRCQRRNSPLRDFVQAGLDAEERMTRAIHANAHKGYLFLSGLLVMAAGACDGNLDRIRGAISATAADFFRQFGTRASRSAGIRDRHGLGGIQAEAEAGLPAVFEHGWPLYREVLDAGWDFEQAGFYLMAILMQRVEDTTAVHRCGPVGLARLRQDGRHLQRLLEQQQEVKPKLRELNQAYQALGLTMGGVADCMALVFALQQAVDPGR